ncbi:uncharacterized protein PAC_04195 [Phialocephala subalpina]|uniref:Uncharacterized protein n=1 Tax=Phialocephala subalpina TaxID=576137 RepID=A0A1L7WNF5_9HELO|nr:uncharacterized protein PAC_04195 [Phialocephala subalpina]
MPNLPAKNQQTSSFQNQQPQNQQSQTTQPQTQKPTTQIQPVSYQPIPRKPVPVSNVPVSYQPIPVTNQTGPTIPTPQPPSPVQPSSSTQSPPPKRRKLTALAEKYGQPPLTPLFGTDPIESAEQVQRARFDGFTTADLHAIEAFAPTSTEDGLLLPPNSPIHPLFAFDRWDFPSPNHVAKYPLNDDRPGIWENPLVWEVLEPVLQLASFIISHGHVWGWWHSLLFGAVNFVDMAELLPIFQSGNEQYTRARCPDPSLHATDEAKTALQKKFRSSATAIQWAFQSAVHDNYSAFEMFEPLMSTNLNPAERALEIFRAANTVLHETGHAMWDIWTTNALQLLPEPFFEDERTSELGFSAENSMFGGVTEQLISLLDASLGKERLPAATILAEVHGRVVWERHLLILHDRSSWDTICHSEYTEGFPVLQPVYNDYCTKEEWPIPVIWFFKIHNPEFWNVHVRHWGAESTRMGPKTIGGRQVVPDTTVGRPSKQTPGRVFTREWYHSDRVQLSVSPAIMSQNEIDATESENKRRNYAQFLIETMYDQDQEMRNRNTVLPQSLMVGPPRPPAANPTNPVDPTNPNPPPSPDSLPDLVPIPPRFDEITKYLLSKYQRLALDTLNFRIAEHTLYHYILHEGGLSLTATEWREFLVYCNSGQIGPHLFLYRRTGVSTGVVRKIMNGWPSLSDPKGVKIVAKERPDSFIRPSTDIMKAFTKYAQRAISRYRRTGVSTGVVRKIMNGWPSLSDPKGVKIVAKERPDSFIRPSTDIMKAFTKYAQRAM